MNQYTPLEQPVATMARRRVITLGLPASPAHHREGFQLTPEAVAMLVDRGMEVCLETGAGAAIHYDDDRYAAAGARITDRRTALSADIVLHPAPLTRLDAKTLKRGGLLLTMLNRRHTEASVLDVLLERHVVTVALDLAGDPEGHKPFADALSTINGRAAVTLAAGMLADPDGVKGILLGGVPGVIPCEVTIIGSGASAIAAANTAMGLGAIVKIFDDDVYSLARAASQLGPGVITSALHPRVLGTALSTADVVIATPTAIPTHLDTSAVAAMKAGVIAMDLSESDTHVFDKMKYVDLASQPVVTTAPSRVPDEKICYTNPGARVNRTVAMALSNAFVAMMRRLLTCDGVTNALKLNADIQQAVLTFMGSLTNRTLAGQCRRRYVNITLLVQFS